MSRICIVIWGRLCWRLQRTNWFSWFYFERCLQSEISGMSMFVSDHRMIRVTGERVRHADRACLGWTSAWWGRGQDIIDKTESKFPIVKLGLISSSTSSFRDESLPVFHSQLGSLYLYLFWCNSKIQGLSLVTFKLAWNFITPLWNDIYLITLKCFHTVSIIKRMLNILVIK